MSSCKKLLVVVAAVALAMPVFAQEKPAPKENEEVKMAARANQVRGELFDFYRDDRFDSRNYFNPPRLDASSNATQREEAVRASTASTGLVVGVIGVGRSAKPGPSRPVGSSPLPLRR